MMKTYLDSPGSPSLTPRPIEDPTLTDSVNAALTVLSKDDAGFFLVVDQGNSDIAAMQNTYPALMGAITEFDQAVLAALTFIANPGDDITAKNTLVIVTADHAAGYLRNNLAMPLGLGDLPVMTLTDGTVVYPDGEVSFATTFATNELVSVYAIGGDTGAFSPFLPYEGLSYPGQRLMDNTYVPYAIADFLGVVFP